METIEDICAPKPVERNQSFYFRDDPMVIFLVENQLFKVHRHYFIEGSEVFRGMFDSPTERGTEIEGMSDELPIPLPGVTVKEFETLLNFFYSLPQENPTTADAQKEQESNLDLLSISHRYVFDKVFKYAVQQLRPENLPIVDRLVLGDKYGLENWLLSAYGELLDRTQTMNEAEATTLGTDRIIRFLKAKEFMYQERLNIANENYYHQKTRAEHAEAQFQKNPYRNQYYVVPAPRTPTPTETVVKRHFCET